MRDQAIYSITQPSLYQLSSINKSCRKVLLAISHNEPIEIRCVTFASPRAAQRGLQASPAGLDGIAPRT